MKLLLLTLAAALVNAQDLSLNDRAKRDLGEQAQAVFGRAREQVDKTISNLPRYVCVENIERAYFHPLKPFLPRVSYCPAVGGKNGLKLRLSATDRVRLEVAVSDGREIDSWPLASQFDTRGIDIVESGPISSGAFGTNLAGVFQNPDAKIEFTGAATRAGRTIFVYHYSVPLESSSQMVRLVDGARWKTAYRGDLEIVADTAELISLTIEAGPLPPFSGMCRTKTTNIYHHVRVGEGEFLIPVTSTFQTMGPNGTTTESTTTFSGCHQFAVETTLRFDADDAPSRPETPAATVQTRPLPGATRIGLRLDSPIDTDTAAAGDIVLARIENPSRKPKVQNDVPAGIRVRGRIMHAKHSISEDRGFDIEITFDALEIGGDLLPFAGVAIPSKPRLRGVNLSMEDTPTGGVIKIHTKRNRVVLPVGTHFDWITLTPPKPKI